MPSCGRSSRGRQTYSTAAACRPMRFVCVLRRFLPHPATNYTTSAACQPPFACSMSLAMTSRGQKTSIGFANSNTPPFECYQPPLACSMSSAMMSRGKPPRIAPSRMPIMSRAVEIFLSTSSSLQLSYSAT